MRDIVDNSSQIRVKSKYNSFNDFIKDSGNNGFSSASSSDSGYSEGAGGANSGVVTDKPSYTSYNNFLNAYGKKEFRSVAPPTSEKKNVKTEMFITIHEPAPEVNLVVRVNKTSGGMKPEILQKPVMHARAGVPSPPVMPPPTFAYNPPQHNKIQNGKPNPPQHKIQNPNAYIPPQDKLQNPNAYIPPQHKIQNLHPNLCDQTQAKDDKLDAIKSNVIDEIRRNGENGFKNRSRNQYVPQNSYQFTKKYSDQPTRQNPVYNTLPKSWRAESAKLSNHEADPITRVPVADESATINKNDPSIHRMVYGTYRGLLSAYNKPANNFVSTLPRNMVVQDKGVADQLQSMQLQGGLAQLNGRTNPKEDP